jgi:MFS transporter, putative metabolite:H+ symporter
MASSVRAPARLDRLPISRFHWRVLSLIGAGLFLDSSEIYIGGSVTGALLRDGWSTLELNAAFVTMTFAGLVIGAWTAGVIGDRLGRRFSYQFNLAIFGLASLAAAVAPNMTVLIGLRFIMGVGLGAELVIGYAMFAEFVPPSRRGSLVALLSMVANSAVFFASLLSLWIIPRFGWRYMFAIVGVGAIIVWFLRKSLPESPRWLEEVGRNAEAEEVLSAIELEVYAGKPIPPAADIPVEAKTVVPLSVLFSPEILPRTIVGCMIMMVIGFSVYGLVGWLPSFFVKQGLTIVQSLTWSTVMSLGGPTGGLIGFLVADRLGRRSAIIAAVLCASAFGLAYQFVTEPSLLLLTGFLLVSAIYTIVVVGQAIYVPELFATAYRMRGTGFCGTAGRLTSAMIQYFVIWLFGLGGVSLVVDAVVVSMLLLGLAVWLLGIETRSKPLEEIAA